MDITPVSNNTNIAYSPLSDNNYIKLLEKRKMQLQDQIQKVGESKQDDKTKQERIKQLQDQIQQIDMEIRLKKNERQNLKQDQNQYAAQQSAGSRSSTGDGGGGTDLTGLSYLVQAGAVYLQSKVINSVKNRLYGRGNVLKIEIKLDEGRGLDSKEKRAELKKIESRGQTLGRELGETNQTVQDQVSRSAKEASKYEENVNTKNYDQKAQESDSIEK